MEAIHDGGGHGLGGEGRARARAAGRGALGRWVPSNSEC